MLKINLRIGSEKMHVLIVPSWYSTPTAPTRGSFFREQALALKNQGIKVTVANCSFLGFKDFGKLSLINKVFNDNGINVYSNVTYSYLYHKMYFNPMPYLYIKKLKKLYKVIERIEGKPDIIHAHSCLWAGPAAIELGNIYNIPTVITEHNTAFSRNLLNKFEINYVKNALNNADKVIAVSNGLKKDLKKIIVDKEINIIPNPVDVNKFILSDSINREKSEFIFFSLCYLVYKKGIDILLRSFAESFKDKKVLLYIGGDGEERENLVILANKLGIDKQVVFLGALSREEVRVNMNKCDAFVLPSRYETFGVVFIEALASGKPIIATDTGGPNDIITKENGLLVQKDNVNELSNAMKKIVLNIHTYNSNEIREDCIKRFSNESVTKLLMQLYTGLIQKGN